MLTTSQDSMMLLSVPDFPSTSAVRVQDVTFMEKQAVTQTPVGGKSLLLPFSFAYSQRIF